MEASPLPTQTPQPPIERSITSFTGARLFSVQSFEVDQWWPHVAHHVRRWIEHDGTWSLAEIKEEFKAARAQLWCFHAGDIRGVWVTRIENTDGITWGCVWGCAGDFIEHKDDAIAFFGVIEDWFRSKGCEFVEWVGRKGWQKFFPDYHEHAVVLRKRL